ncbi:MAG: alpha/beta hydrolase [Alphaproteobacteria bacterium]|nr:alpha/beta hydrolase [Alphaproteobacteria bacterium]
MNAGIDRHRSPLLDLRETHFLVPSEHSGLSLFLSHLPPNGTPNGRVVLYVHGGTFPSGLAVAHRFDGRSWRDELCAAGYHVWGLDFLGFGGSDRYPSMAESPDAKPALGSTEDAAQQLAAAVRFIGARHTVAQVSLVAHSWGTLVAGRVACHHPDLVERLVFFGPIARRDGPAGQRLAAWRLISLRDQWDRFTGDVPDGAAPVLSRAHFAEWGERYLDTDPASRTRDPAAVQVPSGPFQDIFDAFAGDFPYDPAEVRAPVAIIRGEWDSLCTDADAHWLMTRLSNAAPCRDVKIARATHLMHMEAGRYALYRETEAFLAGGDTGPAAV